MKPASRSRSRLSSQPLLPAVQQLRHSWPVDGRRGDRDAGEAGTEHAAIATLIAASPRWGERARDRATSGVARSTIQDNLKRAAAAGLAGRWPTASPTRLWSASSLVALGRARPAAAGRTGLGRLRASQASCVTMTILWEEYREVHPEGYGYSRFCDLLRGFNRRLTPVMRQHHVAGEKAFVDYSGKRIGIADPTTGEVREAHFRRLLGASNLTYAEATWTQTLPDWTGAHVRMFRFFGGPKLLVPDNLKSGVNKASCYEPEINRTYGAMAAHYWSGSCRRGLGGRGTRQKSRPPSNSPRPTF